jgi:hypothetical protein
MKKPSKTTTPAKTDTATYLLPSRQAAWSFMKALDEAKISAGFPSLVSPTTLGGPERSVQVGIRSNLDRLAADKASGNAPVIAYDFAT